MSLLDAALFRIILTDERRERVKLLNINVRTQTLEDVLDLSRKELQYGASEDKQEEVGIFLLCETSENASKTRITHIHQLRDSDTIMLSKVTRVEPFLVPESIEPLQPLFSTDCWWEPRVKCTNLDVIAFVPTTLKLNIKRVVDVGEDCLDFTVTAIQQCFPKHFIERPFQLHLNHQGVTIPPDSTNSLKLALDDGGTQLGITAVYRFPVLVQTRRIWDHWPFVVSKAEISLQANSANRDGVTVRPTMSVVPKNLEQMCRFNVDETSTHWDFISKRPWISVELQERQGVIENKRIQFTYFLAKTWVYDIINVLGPLATITAVSFLNYFGNTPSYFEIQSSLILAIAFVVPQVVSIRERGNRLFENDYYIILLLIAYAATMYPSARVVQLIGNIVLVSCNLFPLLGYIRFKAFVRSIHNELDKAPWKSVNERYTSDVELMTQSGYEFIEDGSKVFGKQVRKAKEMTLKGVDGKKGCLHFPPGIEGILKKVSKRTPK